MARGTTIRAVRVREDVWRGAMTRAELDGTSVSTVMQAVLEAYKDGAKWVTLPPAQ